MTSIVLAAAQTESRRGDITANVETHIRHIKAVAKHKAQLIVFPELSLTGYEPDLAETHSLTPTDPRLTGLQTQADKHDITILAGAPYRTDKGIHISAFIYTPNKQPRIYTKHHLHPGEEKHFTPGNQNQTIKLFGETITPAICADIVHPEHAVMAVENGASVYAAGVMITPKGYENDASYLKRYSVEHRLLVLLSNYASATGGYPSAGRSAAWDTKGNLLAEALRAVKQ